MMGNRITFMLSAGVFLAVAGRSLGGEVASVPSVQAVVEGFCVNCHDADLAKGGLNLAAALSDSPEAVGRHPEVWEKVARRLRGREMPPPGKKRPGEETYVSVVSQLETTLDRAAAGR